ncbi:MAG: tetratricopeptide repeat protein [Bacteroidales bacterium]|nr:tetratricopeptide repeat protein [Bacteroidales bacterium]
MKNNLISLIIQSYETYISFLFGIMSLDIAAQTINQPGEVRTISYEQGKKGAPVADVRIKSKGLNEVRSTADGKFILPVKAEGGNIFTLEDVSRAGYEPVVPSREEFLSRKFAINPASGVTLILASNDQLFAERRRIEQKIRLEKEQEIADRESEILKLQAEVNKLQQLSENITDLTAKLTRMEEELQKFKDSYYSSDDLIRQEAQRLSKIDFQTIDSVQAVIVNLLKEGKGGEVVTIARNQLSAGLWDKIMNDPGSIKRDMEQKKVELKQDSLLLEQAARQLKNMADGFAAKYQNDSAAFYLKKRMEMDTLNLEYIGDYADFIRDFLGSYDEALLLTNRCLDISIVTYGEKNEEVSAYLNNIGSIKEIVGDYSEALKYHLQSIAIQESILGNEHILIATSYNNIGIVHQRVLDYDISLEYMNKALEIYKLILGKDHNNVASILCNIGNVYCQNCDLPNAMDSFTKALEIQLKVLTKDDRHIAKIYNGIGTVLAYEGQYSKALQYVNQAADIHEKIFGPKHPGNAIYCSNIGDVYNYIEDYQNAMKYYEKALKIRMDIFGPDHPYTTRMKEQMQVIDSISFPHIFTFEVVKGYKAFNKGLNGKYIVLCYQDWEIGSKKNAIALSFIYKCRNRRGVVMKEGEILEYEFDPGMLGVKNKIEGGLHLKKSPIFQKYQEWKTNQTNK